ncbi:MAG TPA: phosphatase PAP2 family protein [Candidatus Paceibacterota bacterium]|nr:phosphatase PAP2 family protein [Candidatus Paceibacterota bacterium]
MNALIVFSAEYLYLLSIALFIGYGLISKRRRRFWLLALFVLPASYLTGVLAGHLFYNPRPFVDPNVIPLFVHEADNGFPSDHALLTGTLAAIVTAFNVPLGILMWALAIIVGGARVLARVHHLIDILASYAIAIAATFVARFFLDRCRPERAPIALQEAERHEERDAG